MPSEKLFEKHGLLFVSAVFKIFITEMNLTERIYTHVDVAELLENVNKL